MFGIGEALSRPKTQEVFGNEDAVEELPLPSDFIYGAATAAYQIEGAYKQDGKGPSIWDEFAHRKPSVTSGQHGDVACDHYNRFSDDVDLMASYGLDVYRFSISWSRLIPEGGRNDAINEEGIAFYSNLIDRLLARGIKPSVTLFHWDLPLELHRRYGGPLNTTEFRADFENYARLCFTRFGDRVQQWVTFNEPYIVAIYGYQTGVLAPGHCRERGNDPTTEPYRVAHSIILSHVDAVQAYVSDFLPTQGGSISMVLNGDFYEPYNPANEDDVMAAQRRMEFYIGWFADPVYLGADYPASMRAQLGPRLPHFSQRDREQLKLLAPHSSFYGMNHYTSQFARARLAPPDEDDFTGNVDELPHDSNGTMIGPVSGVPWLRVTHRQFRKLLNWVWRRYQRPIYITENGCPCPGESQMTMTEAVKDRFRVRYFGLYLDAVSRAIFQDGVKVSGYYAWSLMDNFEWSAGYNTRFGITHVDYATLVRTPKSSASYLRETFRERRKAAPTYGTNEQQ